MFFHVGVQWCDIYAEGYHIIGIGCVAEKIKNFFSLPGRKVDLFFHGCLPPYIIGGGCSLVELGSLPLIFRYLALPLFTALDGPYIAFLLTTRYGSSL